MRKISAPVGKSQHPLEAAAANWIEFEAKYKSALKAIELREFPAARPGGPSRWVVPLEEPFRPSLAAPSIIQADVTVWDYDFADEQLARSFIRCVAMAYAADLAPKPNVIELRP